MEPALCLSMNRGYYQDSVFIVGLLHSSYCLDIVFRNAGDFLFHYSSYYPDRFAVLIMTASLAKTHMKDIDEFRNKYPGAVYVYVLDPSLDLKNNEACSILASTWKPRKQEASSGSLINKFFCFPCFWSRAHPAKSALLEDENSVDEPILESFEAGRLKKWLSVLLFFSGEERAKQLLQFESEWKGLDDLKPEGAQQLPFK